MSLVQTSTSTKKPVAIIAQLGGETPVGNRTLICAAREFVANGFQVYGPWDGMDGLLGIDRSSGTTKTRWTEGNYLDFNLISDNELMKIRDKPGAHLRTSKFHVDKGEAIRIVKALKRKDCHHYAAVGGNSTAGILMLMLEAAKDLNYELTVTLLTKTIDNDVPLTDHSSGYPSAALGVADRIYALTTSSDSQSGGVFIVVTMGRNCGYLAAASGLNVYGPNSGADLIYLPEKNFDIQKFPGDIENVLHSHRGKAVVVVSEGIREIDPKYNGGFRLIADTASKEMRQELGDDGNGMAAMAQGHQALIQHLSNIVSENIKGVKVRGETIGYSVRSGTMHSDVDAAEAEAVGRQGVMYALRGENSSCAVAIDRIGQSHAYAITFQPVPLDGVAKEIQMPDLFIDTKGRQVTDKFRQHAGPTLGPVKHQHSEFFLPEKWDTTNFIRYDGKPKSL